MPLAVVHYFSGTGNTHRLAHLTARGLAEAGYEARAQGIEDHEAPGGDPVFLRVFAFPVYACAAPVIFRRFLRSLPPGNGCRAAVLGVRGEIDVRRTVPGYAGQAMAQVGRMLRRRGYDVFLTEAFGYPANITQMGVTPKSGEGVRIIEKAEARLDGVIAKIAAEERSFRRCNPLNQAWSWLFGMGYSLVGRRCLGKLYLSTGTCVGCGICVHACPAKAISLRGRRLRWNWGCQGCQRCINICPRQAIQTSVLRTIVCLGMYFLPYHTWLIPLLPAGLSGGAIKVLLWLVGFGAAGYILDKAIFLLESIPGLNLLAELNFTARARRYLAPDLPRSVLNHRDHKEHREIQQ